jgi:hypothetical protein
MSVAFTLQPFTPLPESQFSVTGEIGRISNQLTVSYRLAGDLSPVRIPQLVDSPQRRAELWEATCFELFLAPHNEQYYWEFNLAPSGDWNLWRLESYRQGLREELLVPELPPVIQQTPGLVSLDLQLNLDPLIALDRSLAIAVTTVIQQHSGAYSYWALQHTGAEADFHRRADFAIAL